MADAPKTKFSRRGFLKGAGMTAATTVSSPQMRWLVRRKMRCITISTVGPDALPVKLHINGREYSVTMEPRYTLAQTPARQSWLDRDQSGLRPRIVFGLYGVDRQGAGACLHDASVDAVGREITTIEGLSHGDTMHRYRLLS